jgi:uncharacterized protein YndB with AHSA1/START domain
LTVDVPQPREDVYAFLDVMANHEQFTDHMLVDWRCAGPATGVGSKAFVNAKAGGRKEPVEIEVLEVEPGRMIRERSRANKGRRLTQGTYTLSDLPDGGTHVEFAFELLQLPASEKLMAPLMRAIVRRGNAKAMERLAGVLRESTVAVQ